MSAVQLETSGNIFLHTDLQKVLVADDQSKKTFGILDLQPNLVSTPPVFTEEATLEAMRNLHVLPEDLVPRNSSELTDTENSVMKIQITIELERRRYETIEKVITERNRILAQPSRDIDLPRDVDPSPKRKRKKTAKKKSKKKKVSPKSPRLLKLSAETVPKKPGRSSLRRAPPLRKSKLPVPSSKPVSLVPEKRPFNAAEFKKNREEEQRIIAEKALARVKAAEKRQEELRKQKEEIIKKKAQERLNKMKGDESIFEKRKRELKEAADAELQRKERTYMRLQERKRKKYEEEQKWRREKIYGETKEKQKQSLSSLRKKLMAAGMSAEPTARLIESEPPQAITKAKPTQVIQSLPPKKQTESGGIQRKRKSGIPRMCRAAVKHPVPVGKGKSKIPCLR